VGVGFLCFLFDYFNFSPVCLRAFVMLGCGHGGDGGQVIDQVLVGNRTVLGDVGRR